MAECAFCGQNRKLSDEHVWPDWLLNELPPPDPSARKERFLGTFGAQGSSLRVRDEGPASVPQVVKVVCKRCNSGWMSHIETRAQPLLTALLRGERRRLQTSDQRLLAFWSAKTMTMVEYTDDATRVTSPEQRAFLYKHRAKHWLPDGSLVWIGSYESYGYPSRGYHHRALTASQPTGGVVVTPNKPNFQQTTFIIGRLILVSFSFTLANFRYKRSDPSDGLRRIYPVAKPFVWPTGPALDADRVTNLDHGLADTLRRGFAGPRF
jgi:hypothetical protein